MIPTRPASVRPFQDSLIVEIAAITSDAITIDQVAALAASAGAHQGDALRAAAAAIRVAASAGQPTTIPTDLAVADWLEAQADTYRTHKPGSILHRPVRDGWGWACTGCLWRDLPLPQTLATRRWVKQHPGRTPEGPKVAGRRVWGLR